MKTLLLLVSTLLLLLISSTHSQEDPTEESEDEISTVDIDDSSRSASIHSTAKTGDKGKKQLKEWLAINRNISIKASQKVDNPCNATVDQTFAYFLLGDLLHFHQISGILAYGYMRRSFYNSNFSLLKSEDGGALDPPVVFCAYANKLICVNETCVPCPSDPRPSDVDPKLSNACKFEGNGGARAKKDVVMSGDLPVLGNLFAPPPPKYCEGGWLTLSDARAWHSSITHTFSYLLKPGIERRCSLVQDLQNGFFLLEDLVKREDAEAELKDYWDYYESRLWMFREGNYNDKNSTFCRHEEVDGKGPWVCGNDGRCVDCKLVWVDGWGASERLKRQCGFGGRPEYRTPRCIETTTPIAETTTTPTSSVNGTEGPGDSGVGIGGSVVVIVASGLFIGFTV